MPYNFKFDLSKLPQSFFAEIASIDCKQCKNKTILKSINELISKFNIQEATGLNHSGAEFLIHDLIYLLRINNIQKEKFLKTNKRALFLPHCSRKYMDSRCKAFFNTDIPTYKCKHCSPDCLVNEAERYAEKKGYDVYILPGGSCISKILENKSYDGIVGVACGEEIKLMATLLPSMGVCGQAVPLIKNGCAETVFNFRSLTKIL